MKLFAIIIMLIALYLLYRIACPRQVTKKDNEIPTEKPKFAPDVMGKSRFVLPDRSKPLQTPATSLGTKKGYEKPDIFASGTEEKGSAVIPAEQLDEVFGNNSNPEIMSVPLENEDEDEIDFEAEQEAEELHRVLGHEPEYAGGFDYDDLQTAVKVIREQPDEVSEETGRTLAVLEDTDVLEILVSGDEGRLSWIKSIVERNIRNRIPETENKISGTMDYGDFIANFLE
jgi:hypothetical protein